MSDDLVVQRRAGPVLPAGRLLHRPLAAGRACRHHPCACRPRAPRPRPLPGRGPGGRGAARPARRGDRPADAALRRGDRASRRAPQLPSRRPCARLGPGAARARRPGLGRLGRLLPRRRPRRPARGQRHLHAVRAGALPLLHHRVDLRPADLPLAAAGRAVRRDRRLVAAQRRGRPGQPDPRLQLRQGAAHPPRRRPLDRPDLRARRGRAAEPRLPRRRRRPSRDAAGDGGRGQGLVPPRPDRRPAVGAGLALDPPLRRAQRCLRQRLDAAARRAPPPLGRPRLRPAATTPTGRGSSAPSPPPAPSG